VTVDDATVDYQLETKPEDDKHLVHIFLSQSLSGLRVVTFSGLPVLCPTDLGINADQRMLLMWVIDCGAAPDAQTRLTELVECERLEYGRLGGFSSAPDAELITPKAGCVIFRSRSNRQQRFPLSVI
jgi:hypothetical protein